LIYATCSLLNDENENIAEQFLASHPDFKLLNAAEILAQQQIQLDTGNYLKLLPHLHNTDGFFAAVFERGQVANDAANVEIATSESEIPVQAEIKAPAKTKIAKPKVVKAVEVKPKAVKPKVAKSKVVKS